MTDVFDENGKMRPEWLSWAEAAKVLTRMTGKQPPYLVKGVKRIWKDNGLKVYTTPLGPLVRLEDAVEAAKRLGWWRREPVQGYIGEAGREGCHGSGESVVVKNPDMVTDYAGHEGRPNARFKTTVACPTCGREFLVPATERMDARGDPTLVCRVPQHKDPQAFERAQGGKS